MKTNLREQSTTDVLLDQRFILRWSSPLSNPNLEYFYLKLTRNPLLYVLQYLSSRNILKNTCDAYIFKQRMLRELKYWKSYEYLIFLCLI